MQFAFVDMAIKIYIFWITVIVFIRTVWIHLKGLIRVILRGVQYVDKIKKRN